ncbi:MAG: TIGR02594 family protein [Fibrobacteria bacterium]
MDMTPVGEPVEEKPKEPEAVLSEGAWVKAETLFHEEADVTVKLKLPPGKEHITRVEVEVHAKRSSGPELIAKGEGHAAADGTATVTIPIYKPKNHDGGIAEYYVTFKHKLAKALEPESLLRKIQETAMKSADHELVPGIVFGTNSSFIRPKVADGLKALETKVKEWEKKHPKGKIVLYGHANADEKDGKALSERRAQSAYAFITNDAATWEKLYTTEKWGLWALQHLLLDLGHYHGKPDNMDGPGTQGAFKAFQKKSGLPETGKEDSATRKALFGAYMKGKHDIKIDAGRFRKVAGNEWMGCSANNRAKEGDAPAPENRRVAFILIEESKFFPIHFPCQDGNEAGCQGQCKKAGKRSAPGIKCSFYDELVREVKQPEVKEEEKEEAETSEIPWITIAEREAKKWKGIKEEEISKTINFHKEVGINLSDLVGTDHAWCASFVNYCLKEAGFAMSSPPCRARSFLTDENFTKIDKPIFGAIAVIGTHHVCFAYADDKKSAKPVMLGGNQSDQINFTVFHESITYLVPKLFDPSKNTIPALAEKTSAELNSEFGIVHSKKTGDATR